MRKAFFLVEQKKAPFFLPKPDNPLIVNNKQSTIFYQDMLSQIEVIVAKKTLHR